MRPILYLLMLFALTGCWGESSRVPSDQYSSDTRTTAPRAAASPAAPARVENPNVTVLVLGDSLSAAYGIEEDEGWVRLAEAAMAADASLRAAGRRVRMVNGSISGDTTSGGVSRLPALLQQHQPDIVIVELGANDGLRGLSVSEMKSNLASLAGMTADAGAELMILGMQLPTNYGEDYTREFAAAFAIVAETHSARLIPFFLEPIALDRTAFQQDGLHPTAAAQPALVEQVLPDLVALVLGLTP